MKRLTEYIIEKSKEETQILSPKERADIKFSIWEEPDKKVDWLKNNEAYQKIEYQYIDKKENIYIDFLLGFRDGDWKLWVGKIGTCSYDDDPYCSLETDSFAQAIVTALDKVEKMIGDVEDDPTNYVQFYKESPAASGSEGGSEGDKGGDDGGDGGGLL